MISKETFQFLSALRKNNSKAWFDENRFVYTACKNEFETFISIVISEIAKFDRESAQTTAKASIFRINRDIRFSNDKQPYKPNFGAFVAKGGRNGSRAGYYIHVEPGACFLAGGIYMPPAPVLKALRNEIYGNVDEFRGIITAPDFVRHFGKELSGEKLRSAPRGFPKDFPEIDYLRYKNYTVLKSEPDAVYQHSQFISEVVTVFSAMAAFNLFINRALEDMA
jgi:uncharacterized protein (TIGR02453 family)